ncbi:cell division protein ZapC [Photobacterium aphoticum]|uniref:Cell division protein ZapC n=2 Tax=Photobacterium aphoticum TaxID=754436 RepID=A0A0J1GL94_9GAMM|nr:cell division protein ZapC [Photobacterium aphoticum]KLV00483.1 cell division protein ZapC [Photobacterium aphoticum]PSU59834.1 cell division protein ZapC [Photobacterium aphoticum]GHA41938.1 cell division protein ZapC [Photobacterium aphoticum]
MLKPNNSWMWYYDQQNDALMLDLGDDMIFRVAIPTKHLIPCAFTKTVFTVDDATTYQTFIENLNQLDLSAPRKAELALNAVAASRFHKPLMPKSWFFQELSEGLEPEQGDVVTLLTEFGEANYLVIENTGCASLCMMANIAPLTLTVSKEMAFCEVIKVMNNRMKSLEIEQESVVRFALVG